MSQLYYRDGKPHIHPFYGVVAENPMNSGALRHFHQLPQHPYNAHRKKWNDFIRFYHENPNNLYTPVFNAKQIFYPSKRPILLYDTSLPRDVSNRIPIVMNSTKANKKSLLVRKDSTLYKRRKIFS